MRILIQRVKEAAVLIDGSETARIGKGLVVFLGFHREDNEREIPRLIDKIKNLRIFEDSKGKMNLSVGEIKGEILIVSQFTLYADARKGRRPSFFDAAPPDRAKPLYDKFVQSFKETGIKVESGRFQASMDIHLINWGPVTIIVD